MAEEEPAFFIPFPLPPPLLTNLQYTVSIFINAAKIRNFP
jgi:hypothetical protein